MKEDTYPGESETRRRAKIRTDVARSFTWRLIIAANGEDPENSWHQKDSVTVSSPYLFGFNLNFASSITPQVR
jgi:hypothetical protein